MRLFNKKKKIEVTLKMETPPVEPPPMGPLERLRLEAWGQAPAGPRSDFDESKRD